MNSAASFQQQVEPRSANLQNHLKRRMMILLSTQRIRKHVGSALLAFQNLLGTQSGHIFTKMTIFR